MNTQTQEPQVNQELTEKQRKALLLIIRSYERRGRAPTTKEIASIFGSDKAQTGGAHLDALAEKGYISVEPYATTAIKVLKNLKGEPVQMVVRFISEVKNA